ncbi:NAD-binding protein, partial [Halolamina salina]
TDSAALREAGIPAASTVVVATRSDRRNLLLAQSIRVRFDTPRVIVLVNSPDRVDPFADAGHEVVCATSAVSTAVSEHV